MKPVNKDQLTVEGKIGDFHISGTLHLDCAQKDEPTVIPNKTIPISWKNIILSFGLPFAVLMTLFLLGVFLGKSYFYWLALLAPPFYGYYFYKIILHSTSDNYNYLKKLTDVVTLLSSFLAATLILLKIFNMNSSVIDYLIYVNKENLTSDIKVIFYVVQSIFFFAILSIFCSFATIKLLFSIKDFNDVRKELNKKGIVQNK